ncbi:MAG TPA: hypothetical protein VHX12_10915, partial [Acidisoma sp.]|nr:hypothetical protein [Acidisoma sp.]
SYGIYIYGWPVEQMVRHFAPSITPYGMAVVALPIAWAAGALSWHLIEKRALLLKRRPKPVAETAAA